MSTTNFFLSAGAGWDRLYAGPLASHVDDFADWLADQGYARKTGRRKLRLVGQFSRWLGDQGLDLPALDEVQLERFRSFRSRLGKYTANVMPDGWELLTWLREAERVAPIGSEPSYHDPVGDSRHDALPLPHEVGEALAAYPRQCTEVVVRLHQIPEPGFVPRCHNVDATSERATIAFRPQVCLAALNIRARKRSPVLLANRRQI